LHTGNTGAAAAAAARRDNNAVVLCVVVVWLGMWHVPEPPKDPLHAPMHVPVVDTPGQGKHVEGVYLWCSVSMYPSEQRCLSQVASTVPSLLVMSTGCSGMLHAESINCK